MKSAVCKSNLPVMPYPNAATRRQVLHQLLDSALVAASGMGIAAMILLFLVM